MRTSFSICVICLLGAVAACGTDTANNNNSSSSSTSTGKGGSGGVVSTGGGGSAGSGGQCDCPGCTDCGGAGPGGSGGLGGGGGAGGNAGGTGGVAAGGMGGGGPNVCTWSSNKNPCQKGFYCDAPGCGQGSCQPVGTKNDGIKVPVCGCDGVNYWNSTTAAAFGVSVLGSGECSKLSFCGGFGTLKCPSQQQGNTYPYSGLHDCGYDVKTKTGCNVSDSGGVCWGMPQKCAVLGIGGVYTGCKPAPKCKYECEAIKGHYTYYKDNGCPQ